MTKFNLTFNFRNRKKDNRVFFRLTNFEFDYLSMLAEKHEDYNLSNILHRLISSCADFLEEDIDLYEKTQVHRLIAKIKKDGE